MQDSSKQSLPWWTWLVPLLACQLGVLISHSFQLMPGVSMIYWPVAIGLVLTIWWGPRVLLGVFLNAAISSILWHGAQWLYAPAYALSDTLAVAAGWFIFIKLLHAKPHLPSPKSVALFVFTSLVPVAMLKSNLSAGLMALSGGQNGDYFIAHSLMIWFAISLDILMLAVPLLVFATPWMEKRGWSLSEGAPLPDLLPQRRRKMHIYEASGLLIVLTAGSILLVLDQNWVVISLAFLWATIRFSFYTVIIANVIAQMVTIILPVVFPALWARNSIPAAHAYAEIAMNLIFMGYSALVISRMVNSLVLEESQRQKAEESLRKSSRLSQVLLEKSSEVISIISFDGRVLYSGPAVENVRGFTPDEIKALPVREWIHPEDLAVFEEGLQSILLQHGNTISTRLRVKHKNGSWIWAEISARNLCGDPDVGGIVVNYHDITASKQAQDLAVRQRDLALALAEIHNLDEGLALCLQAAIDLTGMDSGAIFLFDPVQQVLNLRISYGFGENLIGSIRQYDLRSSAVDSLLENQTLFYENILTDSTSPEQMVKDGCRCNVIIPVIHMGSLLGSLLVVSHKTDTLPVFACAAAESIGTQMSSWILRLQAEEALRKSARSLEDSLQVGRMAHWEYEMPSHTLILNDLFFQMLETNAEAAGGYAIDARDFSRRYLDPGTAHEFLQTMARTVRTGETGKQMHFETKLRQTSGRKLWIACWFRIEKNAQGLSSRMIGMIQDISALKLTEEIQAARLRLADFSENHSISELCQAALDEVGILTDSPVGFYHFLDEDQKTLSLQAWSTRTIQEFCSAKGEGRHYDIDEAGVWVECVRQRRAVVHNDYASLPASQRKGLPPGHAPVLREMVVPVFRQDKIVAILGVGNKSIAYNDEDMDLVNRFADLAWDITERKRTLLAMQNSERKFREVVNASPNSILVFQGNSYVFANPTALRTLGYEEEELLGKPNFPIVHPDYYDLVAKRIQNASAKITNEPVELRMMKKNGESYLAESISTPITFNDLPAVLIISQDITERRRSEEELSQRTMELGLLVISASELSRTLNLRTVYGELYRFVSSAMPCTSIFISAYTPQDGLIRCTAAWHKAGELDVSAFPPTPLEEAGREPQSAVILTGMPLLLNDYEKEFKTTLTDAHVPTGNRLIRQLIDEEARPRSALIIPLKLEDKVCGVIQVFSDQYNAYTKEHLWLVSALSNHAVIAMANSQLYSQAQNELEERRRAEAALRDMLEEKNALIKEIHHRVKNNMQVMISLISLQSSQIADQKIRSLFQESENRIRSMALVHEQLYRSSSLSQIDFGAYLDSLTRDLHATFDFRGSVRLSLDLEPLALPIETAVPCGLIVNEMVTNAFKHAFPGGRSGRITISLRQADDEVIIGVADDGVGIPKEIDVPQLNSLGMKLIYLLSNQVNGRITLDRTQGTKFCLFFKP